MRHEWENRTGLRKSTGMNFSFFMFLISYFMFPGFSLASTTHIVLILHHSFEPESVYVQPGDTVRWLHQDVAAHTVTGTGTESWNSEHMEWGDAYVRVFVNTGTHDYVCLYHPMAGKVMVGGPSPLRPAVRDPLPTKLTAASRDARDALGRRAAPKPSRYEAIIRSAPHNNPPAPWRR